MTRPLHERIRTDLQDKILSGVLAPGDRIATELELMAEYGCARMTVNKALSILSAAGLLDRRKGAGSFVARPRLHSMVLDVPDLPQQVLARGQTYGFRLLSRKVKHIKAEDGSLFNVGTGPVLEVSGLHLADQEPLALEHRQISLTVVPDIERAPFETEPPGTWLLRHVPWTEAETRISAVGADARTGAALLVEKNTPLLLIERRTWRGGDRITSVRQSFRGNAYDLSARFGVN